MSEILKQNYEADNLKQREKLIERACKSLVQSNNKDQFYVNIIGEAGEVTKKQLQLFKESGGKLEIMDKPLSNTIEHYIK